jgi:hypothetical protein
MHNDTRSVVVIAVVQLFFVAPWIVYATYLRELAPGGRPGCGAARLIILLDQLPPGAGHLKSSSRSPYGRSIRTR